MQRIEIWLDKVPRPLVFSVNGGGGGRRENLLLGGIKNLTGFPSVSLSFCAICINGEEKELWRLMY